MGLLDTTHRSQGVDAKEQTGRPVWTASAARSRSDYQAVPGPQARSVLSRMPQLPMELLTSGFSSAPRPTAVRTPVAAESVAA